MAVEQLPSAADLRAEIARHRLRLKDIADRCHLHPKHLSRVLNGANLTERTAGDIERAIGELIAEREAAA